MKYVQITLLMIDSMITKYIQKLGKRHMFSTKLTQQVFIKM